ncbi:DUF4184 family protein [Streptomyces jumonjinensis]|uniref:DUF4184 family protein n=1 Tax=Streptomyces jumonjinensis TaxID=1945 RepID=UPI0037B1FF84
MPFTLSHPAAVLPLLRRPFVPAALVAGAMAPDAPYFLQTLGIQLSAGVWYEPYLNATTSHSPTGVLTVTLPFTLALLAGYHLLRGPLTALLPARLAPPTPEPPAPAPSRGAAHRARHGGWLVLSALIGIATHLVWDSFTHVDGYVVTRAAFLSEPALGGLTVARVLQHMSTVIGLAALAVHLVRRRLRPGAGRPGAAARPAPAVRWSVTAALALAALLGAATQTQGIDAYREETVYDTSRPIVREHGDGVVETTYPSRTEQVPWPTVAENMLSHAAKGAGAWLTGALLLYSAGWHLRLIPSGHGGRRRRDRDRDQLDTAR